MRRRLRLIGSVLLIALTLTEFRISAAHQGESHGKVGIHDSRHPHGQAMLEVRDRLRSALGENYYLAVSGPTAEQLAAGKRTFLKYCTSCHGTTGLGDGPGADTYVYAPIPFSAPEHRSFFSDRGKLEIIRTGAPEIGMPPWGAVLDDDEQLNAYYFVAHLSNGGDPDDVLSVSMDLEVHGETGNNSESDGLIPNGTTVFQLAASHMHNKLVHFPVALGFLGSLLLALSLLNPALQPSARLMILFAAAGATVATVAGYFHAREVAEYLPAEPLLVHERGGYMTTLFLWILALGTTRNWPRWVLAVLSVGTMVSIIVTGFFGGLLSHY